MDWDYVGFGLVYLPARFVDPIDWAMFRLGSRRRGVAAKKITGFSDGE